ncbi:MAG: excinuclease ABC subunit UvrB [Candidatus Nomurabacteria bacterium]|nr:MAG: excinuclease ABC subunit UvrB [Candidatus Nomurabacteria bacterium]
MSSPFTLVSPFQATGDQPKAIEGLTKGLQKGNHYQTLLGVTGSGKTFTMANVIANIGKPTLIISHNKTLAAQLASEFKEFFPENAVDYFVSYYDYYQPEAYIPRSDTYIEKETQINEEIERLRNAATRDLLTRKDVIIVASVSCIYGIGSPEEYQGVAIDLKLGKQLAPYDFQKQLVENLYQRNEQDFRRGTFRVRGDTVDVYPAYAETGLRVSFFGNEIDRIVELDPLSGDALETMQSTTIYPARLFVTPKDKIKEILQAIEAEMVERVQWFKQHDKLIEAQRIEERTRFDMEMIAATGYCNGVENYSRFFSFRKPGMPPYTLLDFFPKDFLLFIDESHITLPQIRGMYEGDRARKQNLVNFGFRLPAALDNRPLRVDEFEQRTGQTVYVSATPTDLEIQRSSQVVEQVIRPTGLLDPVIEIRPTKHQIDNLVEEVEKRIHAKERVLITTLTKRMAEDLAEYLRELRIKVHYLHADVDTMERLEILRDLRLGTYDVVVGINLLREGLDLPEVSLVAILDADKEGYLRSETSLIQTMGRAARHINGTVIMYADKMTGSMRRAIKETERRRKIQQDYNTTHGITPKGIKKAIKEDRLSGQKRVEEETPEPSMGDIPAEELPKLIRELEGHMDLAARNLEFEKAARLRDQISELRAQMKPTKRTSSLRARRGKRSHANLPGRGRWGKK